MENDPTLHGGNRLRAGGLVVHADADVQHRLTETLRKQRQIDVGSNLTRRDAGLEHLAHRGVDRLGSPAGEFRQLLAGPARRLVQREDQRRSMASGTLCDRFTEVDNAALDGLRFAVA